MQLENWVNAKYLENVDKLSREFSTATPFSHLSLSDFLVKDKLEKLREALDSLEYYEEDHDLYTFLRTADVKQLQNQTLKEFRDVIFSEEFREFIQNLTGTQNLAPKGDLHSLKLTHTHYLLCHDDQVQGRKVAFILNLSKDWAKEDGGLLELFASKNGKPTTVSNSIVPAFGQFNIFLVSKSSFHQISEVLSNKERVSLSGWYYEH